MTMKIIQLFLVLLLSAPTSANCDQTADTKLVTFQKFVNGQVPIKEAVVYRELSKTNGVVLNREWWRFGYQNDTWFVQRLKPSDTNSSKLVPVDSNVCGASFTQLWAISDRNLHFADKTTAKGSVPDGYGALSRSLAFCALSLGVPRQLQVLNLADAQVGWNGLEFNTIVRSKWDKTGAALASAPLKGQVKMGESGLPASIEYPEAGKFSSGSVTYEYALNTGGIPRRFVERFSDTIFQFEFLSLAVGVNEAVEQNGYEPSMFADMKLERVVTAWTNEFGYTQKDGKSHAAFQAEPPKLGEIAPKLQGTNWLNSSNPLTLDGLRGKVVLLDFWTPLCPPCIEALPRSESLFNKYKNQGLMVIGVCLALETDKKPGRILKDKNITFPNFVDAELPIADDVWGKTSWSYVLDASPSYVLIDKSGKLVWKSTEGREPTETQIKKLLGL